MLLLVGAVVMPLIQRTSLVHPARIFLRRHSEELLNELRWQALVARPESKAWLETREDVMKDAIPGG